MIQAKGFSQMCDYAVNNTSRCLHLKTRILQVFVSSCTNLSEKAQVHVVSVHVFQRAHVCACVRACARTCRQGIICQCGSEEGQGIKDHKKCMTADNFRLLIKIC